MTEHALGIVGADQDEVEAADLVVELGEVDVAGVGHRAGVERDDLRVGVVGRDGAARGVQAGRDV